ncbi:hypothetical protein KQI61_01415 [Anaerocolumna aminovalerica]|uniref:carbohydrate kinase family protein n=1 Tax=Anaerocolumna aminovalerica TaxID=1527 RepID=UPI001C0E9141|nr:PfkB family carbohydrate kinase [Anaerocolumna aminovalerica]MBU5330845.1 hypothetical protein [Anaerocolumna aminovalerica]
MWPKINSKEYDIICVGDLCADLIIPYGQAKSAIDNIKHDPTNINEQKVSFRSGGSVGNTAKVLGKLKQNPIFITNVGNDRVGQFLKQEMENNNVNMHFSTTTDSGSIVCIAVLDHSGDRTMFTWIPPWSALDHYTSDSFPKELYKKPAIVFSSGMSLTNNIESGNALLDFFKEMKENQSILVFDLNIRAESYGYQTGRRQLFEQVLEYTDIILGSGIEEFGQITGKINMKEAVESMAGKDRCIIARDGGNPVLVQEGYTQTTVETEPVTPVNTVGAGDTFDAAFLMALREGHNIRDCVAFANRIAGYMISKEEHLAIPDNIHDMVPTE